MSDRTEQPTSRRIEEARKKGQVARSIELNTAAILLGSVFILRGPGSNLVAELKKMVVTSLAEVPKANLDEAWLRKEFFTIISNLLPPLGMILVCFLLIGVVVTLAQTRFLFATGKLKPDLTRLNPLNGLKRIFSKQGLVELGRSLLKLALVGWVAYSFLRSRSTELIQLGQESLAGGIQHWLDLAFAMATQIGAAYLVLAVVDYAYQYWSYMRSMRMTKEEVKEDMKRSEGDPFIRNRIRSQQRRMARMRMMANVPKANVVVVNPTHLAVAIEYDSDKMAAPRVLAKGAHLVAQRIVEIAKANNIPVVQNIPLARAMYKTVDIDSEIPPELYMAMAEVLAYIYRLRGKKVFAPGN